MNNAEHVNHILLFTKHPVPGYAKTRLIPSQGPQAAAEISRTLSEHALTTIRNYCLCSPNTAVRIHHANPPTVPSSATTNWLRPGTRETLVPQTTGSLGDRLISAFAQSFEMSASKVIVIGTDAPTVNADILDKAFEALDAFNVVIGPALDGGYYLLGMHTMYQELFENIPWSTSTVFRDTLVVAKQLDLTVEQLSPLRDVDDLDDLLYLPSPMNGDHTPTYKYGKPYVGNQEQTQLDHT